MSKPKRITLQQFLSRVPWQNAAFIKTSNRKLIRLNINDNCYCPITAVFKGNNLYARIIAIEHGIAPTNARMIVSAADDYYTLGDMTKAHITRTKTIRAMMLQRIKEAGVSIDWKDKECYHRMTLRAMERDL